MKKFSFFYTMLTHFRINYLTNLTYFPLFPHFVDFSKVAAASRQAAAADRSAVKTMKMKLEIFYKQFL